MSGCFLAPAEVCNREALWTIFFLAEKYLCRKKNVGRKKMLGEKMSDKKKILGEQYFCCKKFLSK